MAIGIYKVELFLHMLASSVLLKPKTFLCLQHSVFIKLLFHYLFQECVIATNLIKHVTKH